MKYIIDLDGTILNGDKANLDSVQFIKNLQKAKMEFLIMTNSIKSPVIIQDRLKGVGIELELERIMNPISAINAYLYKNNYKTVYIVGSNTEKEQINAIIDENAPEIIIFLDFEKINISFIDLQRIFKLINNGIPVITASKSIYYLRGNELILDTGAFVKLFEAAGNTNIELMGKPSRNYFLMGALRLQAEPKDITVIGDDYSTDIIGARSIGCNTVLIKSGKYQAGDEKKCIPCQCVNNLMDILMHDNGINGYD